MALVLLSLLRTLSAAEPTVLVWFNGILVDDELDEMYALILDDELDEMEGTTAVVAARASWEGSASAWAEIELNCTRTALEVNCSGSRTVFGMNDTTSNPVRLRHYRSTGVVQWFGENDIAGLRVAVERVVAAYAAYPP